MEYLGYVDTQAVLANFAASLTSYPFENKRVHLSLGQENIFDMEVGLLSPAGSSYIRYKIVEFDESLNVQIFSSPNSLNIFGQKLLDFLASDESTVEHIFSSL